MRKANYINYKVTGWFEIIEEEELQSCQTVIRGEENLSPKILRKIYEEGVKRLTEDVNDEYEKIKSINQITLWKKCDLGHYVILLTGEQYDKIT